MTGSPLLQLDRVSKDFRTRADGIIRAVESVSLSVAAGESVGLVGESGSGKSTTGRLAIRLLDPSAGRVLFEGVDIASLRGTELFQFRRRAQFVFQDPFSSLNPRMTVGQIISEPLHLHRICPGQEEDELFRLLRMVGLQVEHAGRYPHQFSGGQRQRISIARALSLRPQLLVADEPVSSLDVSVQAQIINLLQSLQQELGLALLFISHNLAVVRHFCRRTIVMNRGRIVEEGETDALFNNPREEYTRLLLSSILEPTPGTQGPGA